jgi:hypothetical protein
MRWQDRGNGADVEDRRGVEGGPRVVWALAALTLPLLIASVSCASSQTTGGVVAGHAPVQRGKVVVLQVADGRERGGDPAAGSGSAVTSALRDALLARGIAPFTSDRSSLAEGISEAKQLGYDYVLKASITEWEDNATEWSGKPDSAALSVELYDLTPTLLSAATHRKKASSFTMSSGTPDRLLPELVALTLSRVFGPK